MPVKRSLNSRLSCKDTHILFTELPATPDPSVAARNSIITDWVGDSAGLVVAVGSQVEDRVEVLTRAARSNLQEILSDLS